MPTPTPAASRNRGRRRTFTALAATGLATLLGLTACSDPGGTATAGAALVPDEVSADGRLTVATVPYSAPGCGRPAVLRGRLGEAAQAGLEHLIETGVYAEILTAWGLTEEGITDSGLNPPGLKD